MIFLVPSEAWKTLSVKSYRALRKVQYFLAQKEKKSYFCSQ